MAMRFLADGNNTPGSLRVTTISVDRADLETSIGDYEHSRKGIRHDYRAVELFSCYCPVVEFVAQILSTDFRA